MGQNALSVRSSQLQMIDLLPEPQMGPMPEWTVGFVNAFKHGTTFELFCLDTTTTGDPAGGHLLILRDEWPAWEAAARTHGVRLVPSDAPVRLGEWDGGAVVRADPPDLVIVEIPD